MDSILSDALSLIQKQQAAIDDLLQKNKKEASYEQVIYTCPNAAETYWILQLQPIRRFYQNTV